MKRFVREVHRRSLWQVLGIYLAASWIVLQVVDVIGNNFGLPEWVAPGALILLLIGLPIVLATAFVQEGMSGGESEAAPVHAVDAGVSDEARDPSPRRRGTTPASSARGSSSSASRPTPTPTAWTRCRPE